MARRSIPEADGVNGGREREPWLRIVVSTLAWFAIAGGIITLIGWAVPLPRLTDWPGKGISMFPNAAVAAIACGSALWLLCGRRPGAARLAIGRSLAVFCGLLGGMTLFQHVTGGNLGIDELLFKGTWGQAASASPMRIGVPASTSFLFLGLGILLSSLGSRCRQIASILAFVPVAIASLALVGYWFGANQLFGIGRYTGISWQTASILAAQGIALIVSIPDRGLMALLLRRDAGGEVARRLLLPIVVIPLMLGWLRVIGEQAGLFDPSLGDALRTLAEIGLYVGFLCWTAASISRHAQATEAATAALHVSEERFARFMQSLPGLAWIKDLDGRYVFANDAAIAAFRVPREALYGRTDAETFQADVAAEFMANDQRALASPSGVQVIESLEDGRGEIRSSVVSKFPIPGLDGSPVLVGGMAIDITDRMRAETALREADRRKDEFLATLAHELRNPLTPIRYAVQFFKNQANRPAETDWALDIVERQVQQMARLLEDLLDVSRISHGKLVLRREHIPLSEIIERALETSRPLLEAGGQVLDVHLPEQPVILDADPVRLAQVFANLLNNASKYTRSGSRVRVECAVANGAVIVSVKDDGIGIAPEMLSRIFDIFSQVHAPHEGPQGGLGIGLSLVRGLVELHGGSVQARSDGPGRGSEFLVSLPAVEMGQPIQTNARQTNRSGAEEKPALRMLVADDLRDSVDSVAAYFRAEGHTVQTAYDGLSAFAAAQAFRPNVVLLDVGMPGLTGHEVCRRIRKEPWGKDILLVAITGWGQESDRKRALDAGFDHHLVKPVDIWSLRELVHQSKTR